MRAMTASPARKAKTEIIIKGSRWTAESICQTNMMTLASCVESERRKTVVRLFQQTRNESETMEYMTVVAEGKNTAHEIGIVCRKGF